MEGREFVSFSDTGDRTIIVGGAESGQRIYKVQSLMTTMTSPVWKAMFSPDSFLEGNPDATVVFPDDDPDAFLILLRILHFQNDLVPSELPSFDWLVKIAVLCDKYDTVNSVRPYLESWMRPWIKHCLEPGYEHWLFIAWTFGCLDIFNALAASLILDSEIQSDGNIKRTQRPVSSDAMPQNGAMPLEACISRDILLPDILENILRIREEAIEDLGNLFQVTIAQLMESKLCQNLTHNKEACCTLMLACLTKALYPVGLGSRKIPAGNVKTSIKNIASELYKYPFSRRFPSLDAFCDLGKILLPRVAEIVEKIPSAVSDHHKCHIDEQAKKSGVAHLRPPCSVKWTWSGRHDREGIGLIIWGPLMGPGRRRRQREERF